MNKAEAVRAHPNFPWLSLDDLSGLEVFLRGRGWLGSDERVCACEKPGEGNMNLTIRVKTNQHTFIVKQARPWVEKYDHIPAPWDRAQLECRFYERVASIPAVAHRMPQLLGADLDARVLLLENLPQAEPLISLYSGDSLSQDDLSELGNYLRSLHEETAGPFDSQFANRAMRALNHEHIFQFPLAENNGLDLERFEPGLTEAAERLRQDSLYREFVQRTGEDYLADGTCLVHGDYFPGSWLRTPDGVRVIDPEFCFFGQPEVDFGCAIAHFRLACQPLESATEFLRAYGDLPRPAHVDSTALARFAAAEVMRRLIGVAQLPIPRERLCRAELLERSRRAMMSQNWEALWE